MVADKREFMNYVSMRTEHMEIRSDATTYYKDLRTEHMEISSDARAPDKGAYHAKR